MRRWLIVVTLLAGSLDALADGDKSPAAAAYAEAKVKYGAGDYAGAARLFLDAYKLEPDPAYLFNIAQSFRLAEDCVNAAKYYGEFLAKVPNPPNLDAVKAWKTDAEKCAKERQPVPPKDPPKDPNPPKDPPPKDPPPIVHHSSKPPVAAIASFAVGAVALGFGLYSTKQVYGFRSDSKEAGTPGTDPGNCPPDTNDPSLCMGSPAHNQQLADIDRDGKAAQKREVIGFAIAGAAVGAGVFFLVLHKSAESPVAVAPTKGGAMVSTGFSF